jgi:hypothetical protein
MELEAAITDPFAQPTNAPAPANHQALEAT